MKFGSFSRCAAWALAGTFLTLASGCGPANSGGSGGSDVCTMTDFAAAQKSAQHSQVNCFDAGNCNPGVAMIAAAWSPPNPGVTVCTGFLVAADILATNSHCLPSDIEHAGASCAGRLWAFFPSSGEFSGEQQVCDTVISATGHSEKYPPVQDIAFLKLKAPSSRPPMQLSRDGFPDKGKFQLVKMNPGECSSGGFTSGSIQTVECEAEQHSELLPTFDNSHSPLVELGTCEVLHGNSGSPVLDPSGRAVGIIQAFITPREDQNSLLDGDIARLNVATSMACLQTPIDSGGPNASACGEPPSEDNDARHAKAWLDFVSSRIEQDSASVINSSLERTTGVHFKGSPLDMQSTLIAQNASRSKYDEYVKPIPDCVSNPGQVSVANVTIPLLHYRTGNDEFLVPTYRSVNSAGTQAQLTISPSGGGYQAELDATDWRGGTVQLFRGVIPSCR